MADASGFLTMLAALSTAVQQLVDHVFKKRSDWLDVAKPGDATHEARRYTAVHALSFVVGAVLAWSISLEPLAYLGVRQGPIVNALASGLMVSFGSSFFNELLGAVREFKKAQQSVREAVKGGRP